MSDNKALIAEARRWAESVRGVGHIKEREASHLESFGYASLAEHIDALAAALEQADADTQAWAWVNAQPEVEFRRIGHLVLMGFGPDSIACPTAAECAYRAARAAAGDDHDR